MPLLSASQIAEWQAFYALEPWGRAVEDHRFGVLASVTASLSSSKHDWKASDFFPGDPPDPEEERKRKEDALSQWLTMAAAKGKKKAAKPGKGLKRG